MIDPSNISTFVPRLIRFERPTASAALVGGAGVISLPVVAQRSIAVVEMVAVSGPSMAGAQVSLYRNDETVAENFMGTGTVGAMDPGLTFNSARPWLFGLEQLRVVITGAAGARATATVWQQLYLNEYSHPHQRELEPTDSVEIPDGETDL